MDAGIALRGAFVPALPPTVVSARIDPGGAVPLGAQVSIGEGAPVLTPICSAIPAEVCLGFGVGVEHAADAAPPTANDPKAARVARVSAIAAALIG